MKNCNPRRTLRRAFLFILPAVLVVSVADMSFGEIVHNTVDVRYIRINKTSLVDPAELFHIGEIRGTGVGTDYAIGSLGASASTVHGIHVHGSEANLINNRSTTAGATWTKNDQDTGSEFEVEALVDLGVTRSLDTVDVLNRGDGCCQDRLKDFTISVEDASNTVLASAFYSGVAPAISSLELAAGRTIIAGGAGTIGTEEVGRNGRFVRVMNDDDGFERFLQLSEIEVFGVGVIPDEAGGSSSLGSSTSNNDIAVTFDSAQGNSVHGTDASVIDNVLNTAGASYNRIGIGNYVVLDLGSTQDVELLRLWQRADGCCQDRLRDFSVEILTANGAVMASQHFSGNSPRPLEDFTFANEFTIGSDDTVQIELVALSLTSDVLSVGSLGDGVLTIEPGASLVVSNLDASFAAGLSSFNIIDAATINGTFGSITLPSPPNLKYWDLSNLYTTGVISAAISPEPSTCALALLGLLSLGTVRRRRR